MSFIHWAAAALAAAMPIAADAATSADADAIRAELQALKADYDARLGALEARLDAAEAALAQAQATPAVATTAVDAAAVANEAVAAAPANPASNPTAFNPAMSLIFDGTYASLQQDPKTYQIAGFVPPGSDVGPGSRSFSLGESELTLAANIDPYFSGYFVATFDGQGSADVEEAYLKNVGAVPGATIKFGRFKAAFGYQNEVHAHAWDFVDAALPLQAFFGGQLEEDGVQARWVAPTTTFIELGAEAGAGSKFPGNDRDQNNADDIAAFAHVGADLGASWSYRMGASVRAMKADQRDYHDVDAAGAPVTNRFSGDVEMWGLDGVWKWAPNGDKTQRNRVIAAEYFDVRSDGRLTFDADARDLTGPYKSAQSGWYAQAAYQFMPRWRIGERYDALDSGSVNIGLVRDGELAAAEFPVLAGHDPTRWTTMVDFSPSEFSRLRLQYAHDEARRDASDDELFLQYIMSMGAHGAHQF
jgi:hypothetical protein